MKHYPALGFCQLHRKVLDIARDNAVYGHLMTIPGIGPVAGLGAHPHCQPQDQSHQQAPTLDRAERLKIIGSHVTPDGYEQAALECQENLLCFLTDEDSLPLCP
jgi:hypothetical protein